MQRTELGKTGMSVTRLGYGSMGLRGPRTWGVRVVSDEDTERVLHGVLDAGINFIDTAPDYGLAEERIGKYLSGRRDEYYLATKCGCDPVQHEDHLEIRHHFSADVIRGNLESSLKRLRTDVIDLLQFHGGTADQLVDAGLIDLLRSFKQAGKIRYLGVSSSIPNLAAMIDLGVFDTYQIPYSCVEPQHEALVTRAGELGAGVIIRGGIGKGGPQAEIQRDELNKVWKEAGLDDFVAEGMTAAELILRFTLSHAYCHTTIVGTCNMEHMAENVRAAERGALAPEVVAEIRRRVAAVVDHQ